MLGGIIPFHHSSRTRGLARAHTSAGIDRAAPGFDKVKIAPRPTGTITHASAGMDTRHGALSCSWKIENSTFTADVVVPPNTTAEIPLPVKPEIRS